MAVLSWLVTLLSVLIVALLVTLLGRSMFWYNHFYTSICLYGAAATGKIVLIHTLAKNLYYGVSDVFWFFFSHHVELKLFPKSFWNASNQMVQSYTEPSRAFLSLFDQTSSSFC